MNLDRHKLEEERRWRFEHYQDQVRKLVTSLVDAIQREAKYTLEREIRYDDDQRDQYSYVDQAGHLQHAILQAVNNADFGGLTRDAGDLHAVEMALHMLAKLKGELPSVTRLELEAAEDEALRERIAKKEGRIEELEQKDREDCVATVHAGGRGATFHRCQKKGKHIITVDRESGYYATVVPNDHPNAVEVRVCGTHKKEADRGHIHMHHPTEWQAQQNLAFRQKEEREISAMRARLAGELVQGEAPKEIEAGS